MNKQCSINVLYFTGTRADFGLMKNNLRKLQNDPDIRLFLIAGGLHLTKAFNNSLDNIRHDGFEIFRVLDPFSDRDENYESTPLYIADTINQLYPLFLEIKQDFTIILGDRSEMLGAAITSSFMNIPVIHLGGGHKSGNIDDLCRQSISMLSQYHLVSSVNCMETLCKSAIKPDRIFLGSASGIETIKSYEGHFLDRESIFAKFSLPSNSPLAIMIYHPTNQQNDTMNEFNNIIEAISHFEILTIALYSNLDPGGKWIHEKLQALDLPYVRTIPSLPHFDFINLMKYAQFFIGNSSCGIIEAPYFKLPFVNVGSRQEGRERSANVIDVPEASVENIINGISIAKSCSFKKNLKTANNPYDNGNTSEILINIIKSRKDSTD